MLSVAHIFDAESAHGVAGIPMPAIEMFGRPVMLTSHLVDPRQPLPPQLEADVVVVHFAPSWSKLPFFTFLKAERGERPIVLVDRTHTRGFELNCVPNRKAFRNMLRLGYRLVDIVVAGSADQAAWMREGGLAGVEKIAFIPAAHLSAGLISISPSRRDRKAPLRLLTHGRSTPQSGFDVLLLAMQQIDPSLATLRIACSDEPGHELQKLANLIPHVSIVLNAADALPYLDDTDAVVAPNRWGPVSRIALEGMIAARPIVVTSADGQSEGMAADFAHCVLPQNPGQLAAAIRTLVTADIGEMGCASRAAGLKLFGLHGALWGQLLERLVTSGRFITPGTPSALALDEDSVERLTAAPAKPADCLR